MLALHHFASEGLAILISQGKLSADLGLPNTLGGFGDSLALHAPLLMFEVPNQTTAGRNEQHSGLPRKRLCKALVS